MECLSDATFKNCGCVPFNYIRNKTMKICDVSSWKCALNAGQIEEEEGCSCLTPCNLITYNYEILENRLNTNFSEK
jgi:Amiloride-sensitive sodium channel